MCYIRILENKTAVETIHILENAISKLSDDDPPVDYLNYNRLIDGNIKRSLSQLLTFAKITPEGRWYIY